MINKRFKTHARKDAQENTRVCKDEQGPFLAPPCAQGRRARMRKEYLACARILESLPRFRGPLMAPRTVEICGTVNNRWNRLGSQMVQKWNALEGTKWSKSVELSTFLSFENSTGICAQEFIEGKLGVQHICAHKDAQGRRKDAQG